MKRVIGWIVRDRRRAIGLALLLIGVALLAFKAWQVASTARSLQARLALAQAMAQSPNRNLDLAQVESLLMGVRADVQSLRSEAGPFLSLAPHLGWLPGIGGDLQAAPALLDMANGLTEAGMLVWQAMSPLAKELTATSGQTRSTGLTQQALAQLNTSRPQLERAREMLARALSARTAIQPEKLSPRLGEPVRKLDPLLPLAQMGLDIALAAPEMLGQNGPRTYLILAQNEDEIRPAGGFISGAGRITFDRGKLTEFSFMDPYFVDDWTQPYPDPPEPVFQYMGMGQRTELWTFRDSNWSPDFPTSAKQAAYFYTYGQHVPVDGVIALDQRAVQLLISAIEPVKVPITDTQVMVVTGSNVIDVMRESWNPAGGNANREWLLSRKAFIGKLAAAIRVRVENDPGSVPWESVARAMQQALDERHIMVYLTQPDLAASLARQGWDGAIRSAARDYLMVVDANMGYDKANALVTQKVNYTVALATNGSGQATLGIDYIHPGKSSLPCRQEQPYAPGITYQSLMNLCFYDYVRIYVPRGAQLLDASGQHIPGSYFLSRQPVDSRAKMLEPEASKSVFALFFVVEPGQNWQTNFSYQLPPGVAQKVGSDWQYSLMIQKQPGKSAIPTTVVVNLPPGAQVTATNPRPLSIQEGKVRFDLQMARDTHIEVQYRD